MANFFEKEVLESILQRFVQFGGEYVGIFHSIFGTFLSLNIKCLTTCQSPVCSTRTKTGSGSVPRSAGITTQGWQHMLTQEAVGIPETTQRFGQGESTHTQMRASVGLQESELFF